MIIFSTSLMFILILSLFFPFFSNVHFNIPSTWRTQKIRLKYKLILKTKKDKERIKGIPAPQIHHFHLFSLLAGNSIKRSISVKFKFLKHLTQSIEGIFTPCSSSKNDTEYTFYSNIT